jgi:hypothetical protein
LIRRDAIPEHELRLVRVRAHDECRRVDVVRGERADQVTMVVGDAGEP